MLNSYQSLSQAKWDCKYHVVFVPKYGEKAVFAEIRQHLGGIFHDLARQITQPVAGLITVASYT